MDVAVYSAMLGLWWYMLCVSLRSSSWTPDREVDASRCCDFTAHAGVSTLQVLFLRCHLFVLFTGEVQDYGLSVFNASWLYSGYMYGVSLRGYGEFHAFTVEIPHVQFLVRHAQFLDMGVDVPVAVYVKFWGRDGNCGGSAVVVHRRGCRFLDGWRDLRSAHRLVRGVFLRRVFFRPFTGIFRIPSFWTSSPMVAGTPGV